MEHFKVVNFEKFQHYKKRRPPWVKLYNNLLEDYAFLGLDDETKYHFIAITLLASRYQNAINWDASFVARQIGAKKPVNLQALQVAGFIEVIGDASKVLATCKQSAIPETERETETEGESVTNVTPAIADSPRVLKVYMAELTKMIKGNHPELHRDIYKMGGHAWKQWPGREKESLFILSEMARLGVARYDILTRKLSRPTDDELIARKIKEEPMSDIAKKLIREVI